jgi:hypothetical protein
MLHVRYVHLTKVKRIHKIQTSSLVGGDVAQGLRPGSVAKKCLVGILEGLGAEGN